MRGYINFLVLSLICVSCSNVEFREDDLESRTTASVGKKGEIDFKTVLIGEEKALEFEIKNMIKHPLKVEDTEFKILGKSTKLVNQKSQGLKDVPSAFVIGKSNCPEILKENEGCKVTLKFFPTEEKIYESNLQIKFNHMGSISSELSKKVLGEGELFLGVKLLSPLKGSFLNKLNMKEVLVSGTCKSVSGGEISFSGVTKTLPCEDGKFKGKLNLSSAPEGSIDLTATITDANYSGYKKTDSIKIVKDTVAPQIIIDSVGRTFVAPDTLLFNVSGSCSEEGQEITFNSTLETVFCTNGNFSKDLDLVSQPMGNILTASIKDAAGNSSMGAKDLQMDPAYLFVYGEEDIKSLENKIAGYTPPNQKEIFSKWSRFGNDNLYEPSTDFKAEAVKEGTDWCFVDINETPNAYERYWVSKVVDPSNPGKKVYPDDVFPCTSSSAFLAYSWIYSESLKSVVGVSNANLSGFVSSVKFESYSHEVTLASSTTDDDLIGLVVALTKDQEGILHFLIASRNKGGLHKENWNLFYYNSTLGSLWDSVITLAEFKVGSSAGGWNNSYTKLHVERKKEKVTVKTSDFSTTSNNLTLKDNSLIELNMAKNTVKSQGVTSKIDDVDLSMFLGPKSYGYATVSQRGSRFLDISFKVINDDNLLYDLMNKKVYEPLNDGTGKYKIIPGINSFKKIGYPRKIINLETEKAYQIEWNNIIYKTNL